MEFATRYTVQLITDLSRRRPPPHFKDGYSPEFMLRKWHLCAVLNIRRHLTGQHGKTRWVSLARFQNNICYVYQVLRSRASGLGLSTTRVQDILRGGDESYWIDLGASLSVAHCTNLIINLKRALHGRKRQEMRLASSGYSAWVEQMREQGRAGKVIKAVLGSHAGRKHQDGLSLDTLRLPGVGLVGDPQQIHSLTTAHFVQHYALPDEHRNALHAASDWGPIVADKDRFMAIFQSSNIPQWCLDLIHCSLQYKVDAPTVCSDLNALLRDPPTLQEFLRDIRQAPTKSAPGMSGLSYRMLKHMPPSALEYFHTCFRQFWLSETTPASWKWRWLQTLLRCRRNMLTSLIFVP